jgi:hypothetical protein
MNATETSVTEKLLRPYVPVLYPHAEDTGSWLSDDAKEKLCRSNMTFISDRSTTA